MIPKNLTTDARTTWHRENYARMKSDPARWAKEVERKRRDSAARRRNSGLVGLAKKRPSPTPHTSCLLVRLLIRNISGQQLRRMLRSHQHRWHF
jgi:hypothetical protein